MQFFLSKFEKPISLADGPMESTDRQTDRLMASRLSSEQAVKQASERASEQEARRNIGRVHPFVANPFMSFSLPLPPFRAPPRRAAP